MSHLAHKHAVHDFLRTQAHPVADAGRRAATALFAPDVRVRVVHPFNEMQGIDGYVDGFLATLHASFDGLYRRTDILIGGDTADGDWVSCHGQFVGKFARPWLGLAPSGRLEFLRVGEFFRFEGGQVVEVTVFLDIPGLMIATDQWPIADSPGETRGYTGFLPGPASGDGVQLHDNAVDETKTSLKIIETMLKGLATHDEAWRPFWHENMMWYGPAAFGAFVGVEDFRSFQVPFEGAFTKWTGGLSGNGVTTHFTRFADGNYACIGGWPSLMCDRKDMFLGQPSQGERVFMRVCDWWRREGDVLVENWVFVDIPDVLLQMGVDVFEGQHDVPAGPRATA